MKRVLSLALALLIMGTIFAFPAGAVTEAIKQSGDWEYRILDNYTAAIYRYNGSEAELTVPEILDGYTIRGIGFSLRSIDYNTTLESITLPDSITDVEINAFRNCTSLKIINLNEGIKHIGSGAFENTAFYNNENNWENGALYLGNYFIRANPEKTSGEFSFKEDTKAIADSAFKDCGSLTSVTLPDGITSIGSGTFSHCKKLKNITIPDTVISIGSFAFLFCKGFTEITIPESVTEIGTEAFKSCTNIKNVTVPKSVKLIEKKAFGFSMDDKIKDFTITGYVNSGAQKYAINNGVKFIDIETGKFIPIPINKCKISVAETKVYTGKEIRTNVTPSLGDVSVAIGRDYSVKYSNNKNVGTATVTIKGIGAFGGTVKASFKIVPKKTNLTRLASEKKSAAVKWKKNTTQTTGYQLQYGYKSSFKGAKTKCIKKNTTAFAKISGLKSGKRYYVRIRTSKSVKGVKYYSAWSKAKSVKVR